MAVFESKYDIGDTVETNRGSGVVKAIRFGSDRQPYYELEFAVSAKEGATKYDGTTLPEAGVRDVAVAEAAQAEVA